MDPLEFSSHLKHMRECFIELLKRGDLPLIQAFLEGEAKSLESRLVSEPLDGDAYCVHFCAEFGHGDIMGYFEARYGVDMQVRTVKTQLSADEILKVNRFNV